MPYPRRTTRSYTRKTDSAVKLQRFIRRRRSARAQSAQLVKTNKRINKIRDEMRKDDQKYGLYKEFISTALTDKFLLIAPANTAGATSPVWNNCFADNTNALLANRVRLGRCHMKMQFTCGNERSPVTYSIFHVRLQPRNAEYVVNQYGDDLATLPAIEGYIRGTTPVSTGDASGGGNVMLNPDWFIVKKQWRFTLSAITNVSNTSATTTPIGNTKNIDYSFPLNYTLGKGISSWGTVSADTDTPPHLRNYILIFSDNIGTDLQYNQYDILCQATATYQ